MKKSCIVGMAAAIMLFITGGGIGIMKLIGIDQIRRAENQIVVEEINIGCVVSAKAIPANFIQKNRTEVFTDRRRVVVRGYPEICIGSDAWISKRKSGLRYLCMQECEKCTVME